MAGHQGRRWLDAEVDVVAILQPARRALTMRSRMSINITLRQIDDPHRQIVDLIARCFLDALLAFRALKDVFDEDPRRHDVIRIDLARLDEVLDFGNRHGGGRRHHRIEVPRRAPIREIAEAIGSSRRNNEREVGMQRHLEHVGLAVDDAGLLALGDDRSVRGRREEAADARAGGANPLRERALRNQVDFDLFREVLALELLVPRPAR